MKTIKQTLKEIAKLNKCSIDELDFIYFEGSIKDFVKQEEDSLWELIEEEFPEYDNMNLEDKFFTIKNRYFFDNHFNFCKNNNIVVISN